MHHGARAFRWRPPAVPVGGRTPAIVGLVLLVTACGGSSPSTGSSSGANAAASAVAVARCMRAHGVQHWPDPDRNGAFDKSKLTLQQLRVTDPELHAAQRACQQLFSNSSKPSQAQNQRVMIALWKFARCLRTHGVTHWPDPLAESDPGQPGTPGFPRDISGVDQNAPQVKDAMGKCQHRIAAIGYGSGGYP